LRASFLKKIILTFACFLTLGNLTTYAEDFVALDTIAGTGTMLRVSGLTPQTEFLLVLKNPNGEVSVFEKTTTTQGVFLEEIEGEFLEKSGKYKFDIVLKGEAPAFEPENVFTVLPGQISKEYSIVYPETQKVILGQDAQVTVLAKDQYQNPISELPLELIGENSSYLASTNKEGMAKFQVITNKKEIFQVQDIYSGITLKENLIVNVSQAIGNNDLQAQALEFFNLPNDVASGGTLTLGLRAIDQSNNKIENYQSTVRFSVDGENAIYARIPDDFTFEVDDQGEHVFNLAFSFQRPGSYLLRATDIDNPAIFGELQIEISGDFNSGFNSDTLTLDNPLAGTYSSATQVISGTADPGAKIAIFDNGIEIASTTVGISGKFNYTTGILAEGSHRFYVAELDENNQKIAQSATVEIKIDTSGAEIDDLIVTPDGQLMPQELMNVRLFVNEDISGASLRVDSSIFNFEEKEGFYEVEFTAPLEFGEYPVDITLIDELGNTTQNTAITTLYVGKKPSQAISPPAVQNLVAAADDNKVNLSWSNVEGHELPINRYRVYYGDSPARMINAVDTFDAKNEWFLPNLVKGQTYYFAVVAIDDQNNVSKEFSNIASASLTFQDVILENPDLDLDNGGPEAQEALKDLESEVSETGPEIFWLLTLSFISACFYIKSGRHDISTRIN
jgi:hypothetical protein